MGLRAGAESSPPVGRDQRAARLGRNSDNQEDGAVVDAQLQPGPAGRAWSRDEEAVELVRIEGDALLVAEDEQDRPPSSSRLRTLSRRARKPQSKK